MHKDAKRLEKTKYALLTKRFCDALKFYLNKADVVLIEAQMQAKMKVVQTAMQCFYWEKSHIVGPLAVRKFFGISMSNYRLNKKKSIELAPLLIKTKKEKSLIETFKKKDDVADAIILAKYWDMKIRGDNWIQKKRKRCD